MEIPNAFRTQQTTAQRQERPSNEIAPSYSSRQGQIFRECRCAANEDRTAEISAGQEGGKSMSLDIRKLKKYELDPMPFWLDLDIMTPGGLRRFGDIAHDYQLEWLQSLAPSVLAVAKGEMPPTRVFLFVGTKGAGKDFILAIALAWLIVFAPHGLLIQVGAGDFDQASEYIKWAKELIRHNDVIAPRHEVQASRTINADTGTIAECLTRDSKGSHGARPSICALNELTNVSDEEFAQTLLDNAAKMPGGIVILMSNAGVIDSWQHRWIQYYRNSPRCKFHEYNQPAPHLDAADVADAEFRNPTGRFRRLYWGEFNSDSGDFLTAEYLNAAFRPDLRRRTQRDPEAAFVAIASDLGYANDLSAAAVVSWHPTDGMIYLYELLSWKPEPGQEVSLTEVSNAIIELALRYRADEVRTDVWQARGLIEQLSSLGIPVVEAKNSGAEATRLARTALGAFRERRIALFMDDGLRMDLERMTIQDRPAGIVVSAPRTKEGHSDRGYALLYGIYSCALFAEQPPVTYSFPVCDDPMLARMLDRGFVY
jgi:hypothetical protein